MTTDNEGRDARLIEHANLMHALPFSHISHISEDLISILAEVKRLREALTSIAAFDDDGANRNLARTGSYSSFDEPGSVQTARAALAPTTEDEGA